MLNLLRKIYDYSSIFFNKNLSYINLNGNEVIEIDLSHSSNHWGDTIFFGPLIESFCRRKFNVYVKDRFNFLSTIYSKTKLIDPDIVIIRKSPLPWKLNGNLFINFYSFPSGPIAKSLHSIFSSDKGEVYELDKLNFKNKIIESSRGSLLADDVACMDKFIVYSPGINSRKFGFYPRRHDVNRRLSILIEDFCVNGIPIILIGDSESKNFGYKFSSNHLVYDFSGKTTWQDLVAILNSPNCLGLISYDNFPYHLAVLLGVKTYLFSKSWLSKGEYLWVKSRYTPAF